MQASIVDLRYKTKEVMRALERNEEVQVFSRGKLKGKIIPAGKASRFSEVRSHPFFGSAVTGEPVDELVNKLRNGRY